MPDRTPAPDVGVTVACPERVVLVSVPKAGTHLAVRLLERCGYRLIWRLFHELDVDRMQEGFELVDPDEPHDLSQVPSPQDAPAGTCLVVHRLSLETLSPRLYVDWLEGRVAIVFNYRDPRDTLLSAIEFLTTLGDEVMPHPSFHVQAEILASVPAPERVRFYLRHLDGWPQGPLHPRTVLEDMQWLLHHPRVHRLRYESLVGPKGGGTAHEQAEEVARLQRFLGRPQEPDGVRDELYSTDAQTFNKGRRYRWREVFDDAQQQAFERRWGPLIDAYGYREVDGAGST